MMTKANREQGATAQWLLSQIEEFLTINDMDNDGLAFGWQVSQDRSLVTRLRDGGDVTTTQMDKILAFMQDPVTPARSRLNLVPLKMKRRALP